jgi:two-component system, NtrC family, sensor kinase
MKTHEDLETTLFLTLVHELKSPIQFLESNMEYMEDILSEPSTVEKAEINEIIKESKEGIGLINETVSSLLNFRKSTLILSPLNLEEVLQSALTHSKHVWKGKVDIEFKCEDYSGYFHGSAFELERVIIILISNGVKAILRTAESGKIHVIGINKSHEITIKVKDSGPGIDSSLGDDIFKPFVSGDLKQGGTGLGLPMAKNLIEEVFMGTIEYKSSLGKGCEFSLTLPKKEKELP